MESVYIILRRCNEKNETAICSLHHTLDGAKKQLKRHYDGYVKSYASMELDLHRYDDKFDDKFIVKDGIYTYTYWISERTIEED